MSDTSWNYVDIWDKFPVPARPTRSELLLIENEMKKRNIKNPNLNVLILGSTIEYRSLCKKLNIIPTVVDFSKNNFITLSSYAKEKFNYEIFIEKDWLSINDQEKYDIILGHRVINVIKHTQLASLISAMYCALKNGGVFFCRGNVRLFKDRSNLEEIREKWAFRNRTHPLFTYLEVELYFNCSDKNGYLDYKKARSISKKWFEKDQISEKDYSLMNLLLYFGNNARFNSTYKSIIEPIINKQEFSKIDWIILDKEFANNMPLIKLIK